MLPSIYPNLFERLLFIDHVLIVTLFLCRHAMYDSYEEISRAAQYIQLQKYADGNPLRKGLKLHAWKITLVNPQNRQPISFCAPPPSHLRLLLDQKGMSFPN